MGVFESVKSKIISRITSKKDTAYMLNYLTLQIKELDIRKDLVNHVIEQRVFIHWLQSLILSVVVAMQSIFYKQSNDSLTLIVNLIYFLGFGVVNTIFLFKFKAGLRWTSSGVMLCQSVFLVYASSPYGVKIASSNTPEMIYLQILGSYLVCSVINGQSDFWASCILQCPVFIVAAIMISHFRSEQTALIKSYLPDEAQYLVKNESFSQLV